MHACMHARTPGCRVSLACSSFARAALHHAPPPSLHGLPLQLFRTWGSVMAMLPVGGSKVWGNATNAPDDDDAIRAAGRSFG